MSPSLLNLTGRLLRCALALVPATLLFVACLVMMAAGHSRIEWALCGRIDRLMGWIMDGPYGLRMSQWNAGND